jgi:hypothetical protein
MSLNKVCNKQKISKNDIIYTPKPVALKMIEMCDITPKMKVLDPSRGGGVFYDNLPDCQKSYCEIEENKDFFNETERYDLIIGNPPYSCWTKWLKHTIKLTDKFCYIFGTLNLTPPRLKFLFDNGFGITKIHLLSIQWWFSNSFLIVFEKNKPSIMTVQTNRIYCDICNSSICKRGRNGNLMNECTIIK